MEIAASPEGSLLGAARALQAAADMDGGDVGSSAESLCLLCSSLLPPNLDLRVGADPCRSLRGLIQDAEAELRRFPVGAYPVGTVEIVVGLCDLLRETAELSS